MELVYVVLGNAQRADAVAFECQLPRARVLSSHQLRGPILAGRDLHALLIADRRHVPETMTQAHLDVTVARIYSHNLGADATHGR